MSLIKLLKIPTQIFKKDSITFLKVQRHDLGTVDDKLHYIAVRPTASLSQIRQKLWYLLNLPDYCDEILVLKTEHDEEIPLTIFRKGNDPQHPYILEVWPPGRQELSSKLTVESIISDSRSLTLEVSNKNSFGGNECSDKHRNLSSMKSKKYKNNLMGDYTKSDLSCKVSTSTLFFKVHGRKSRDNFANLLFKIQNDLSLLSNKLSNLENRIT